MSKFCLNCEKEIPSRNKYCNNICQGEYEYKLYISLWLEGKKNGVRGVDLISNHIRRYLFTKFEDKCCKCGWSQQNQFSNLIPLLIHHIDGNCINNIESNLELLCPNCHSLTENYGNRNKNSTRTRK